jgi:hypothetical protein
MILCTPLASALPRLPRAGESRNPRSPCAGTSALLRPPRAGDSPLSCSPHAGTRALPRPLPRGGARRGVALFHALPARGSHAFPARTRALPRGWESRSPRSSRTGPRANLSPLRAGRGLFGLSRSSAPSSRGGVALSPARGSRVGRNSDLEGDSLMNEFE